MNKKITAITLAGAMTFNTIAAFAQLDRTAGIGENQISQGLQKYQNLRSDLLKLDSSLMKTSEAVKSRDQQGSV